MNHRVCNSPHKKTICYETAKMPQTCSGCNPNALRESRDICIYICSHFNGLAVFNLNWPETITWPSKISTSYSIFMSDLWITIYSKSHSYAIGCYTIQAPLVSIHASSISFSLSLLYTHTRARAPPHSYIYIFIYIYICVCVCVCVPLTCGWAL